MPAVSWSEDRVSELEKWVATGATATMIGHHMRCTRNAVLAQCNRRGLRLENRPGPKPGSATVHVPKSRKPATPAKFPPVSRSSSFNPVSGGVILPARSPKPEIIATATASLTELDKHRCHWPIGDPQDAMFGYCGRPSSGRYCDAHERVGVSQADVSARARMDRDFEKLVKWAVSAR
jgi:GcrA cell cycle regulator